VNPGGEPDRDDFGLPPVDIEIPDDARELDRDVQAYHRELRALRRQLRLSRLYRPVTGDGVVMPLLAGCLIFALIAAVVLTVFTASGDVIPRGTAGAPGSPASPPPSAPAATGAAGVTLKTLTSPLPAKTIRVGGRAVPLRGLMATALALVPRGCRCDPALRELLIQAGSAGVPVYLVGSAGTAAGLKDIAAAASPPGAKIAVDRAGVLARRYQTGPAGLSLILVRFDRSLQLARTLPQGFQLQADLQALHSPRI
jgi:hypothetical protein